MDATRDRFGSMIEWIVAAVFIVALAGVSSVVVREARTVSAVLPSLQATTAAPAVQAPAGVPSRAVSVPVLLLPDAKEVRVGDEVADIAARLGREAEVGTQIAEPGLHGERLTRFYEHQGTRFVLVFEPFRKNGEPRVAAIYLQ